MVGRLITLRDIRATKISRSRSWIFAEMSAGRFPRPLPGAGKPNLWLEADVDAWLSGFVAAAKGNQPVDAQEIVVVQSAKAA